MIMSSKYVPRQEEAQSGGKAVDGFEIWGVKLWVDLADGQVEGVICVKCHRPKARAEDAQQLNLLYIQYCVRTYSVTGVAADTQQDQITHHRGQIIPTTWTQASHRTNKPSVTIKLKSRL